MALSFDMPRNRVAELVEYLDTVRAACFVVGPRRVYTDDLRDLLVAYRALSNRDQMKGRGL